MAGLIGLNLVRNPGRTALTAAGIAIGVATIVALLSLTQGLKQSVGGLSHLGGASLGIFQGGVADPTASVLPESLVGRVREQPGVQDAAPPSRTPAWWCRSLPPTGSPGAGGP